MADPSASGGPSPKQSPAPVQPVQPPSQPQSTPTQPPQSPTQTQAQSPKQPPKSHTLPSPVATGGALRARFRNFDDRNVYNEVKAHGMNDLARNFVVRFGAKNAEVALDLDTSEFEALLKRDNRKEVEMPIRWINIWNPSQQRDTIECIGRQYGFSGRLTLTIKEWDRMRNYEQILAELAEKKAKKQSEGGEKSTATTSSSQDVEKTANGQLVALTGALDETALFTHENSATFRLMQDSMNYTTIDVEKQFVCAGANWLHNRPESAQEPLSLVPPSHRSWFTLCTDNTVLTFHEAACYEDEKAIPKGHSLSSWRSKELASMRWNTLKVLRQLSTCGLEEDKHKIMQLTAVRSPLMQFVHGQTAISENDHPIEGSSNLFYYLFEDYSAAVSILNDSKNALKKLSERVLRTANRKNKEDTDDIVPSLYELNKELRQLQHLFASYKTLIERVLAENSNAIDKTPGTTSVGTGEILSKKARDRFERLRDQLQSLMLDTILDYLEEKKSLQETYFQLTQQKDSRATAKLTRNANLLAKFGGLFLPITLMTSYFSVQIPDLTDHYNGKTYWATFAIVVAISVLGILTLGRLMMWMDHYWEQLGRWVKAQWRGKRAAHREAEEKSPGK